MPARKSVSRHRTLGGPHMRAGQTIANLVTVPSAWTAETDFYYHAASVNLVADLAGYCASPWTGRALRGRR